MAHLRKIMRPVLSPVITPLTWRYKRTWLGPTGDNTVVTADDTEDWIVDVT